MFEKVSKIMFEKVSKIMFENLSEIIYDVKLLIMRKQNFTLISIEHMMKRVLENAVALVLLRMML
jgi:hypothetical protein